MVNNNRFFYISGFISFSLFSLFILLFIFTLFKPSMMHSYALKKDNFISISLKIPKDKSLKQKTNEVLSEPEEEVVEIPKQKADINKLFSDVWTKKIIHKKVKPKKVDNRKYLELQKKIKTTQTNKVKSIANKVNNLDSVKSNNENEASSTAQEVNEYLAKIQAIVYQHFHVPTNSEGNVVKTLIELNAFGKMIDFRVLNYSQNSALNSEADKIKNRLEHVNFPINPQNKSSRTIVLLISEE